jgi:hypothetical protein
MNSLSQVILHIKIRRHRRTSSLSTPIYRTSVTQSQASLARESVPLLAQAPKEVLVQNPGHSLRADSTLSEVKPKWVRKRIIHATFGCITRTAGLTAEGNSGASGNQMGPRITVDLCGLRHRHWMALTYFTHPASRPC